MVGYFGTKITLTCYILGFNAETTSVWLSWGVASIKVEAQWKFLFRGGVLLCQLIMHNHSTVCKCYKKFKITILGVKAKINKVCAAWRRGSWGSQRFEICEAREPWHWFSGRTRIGVVHGPPLSRSLRELRAHGKDKTIQIPSHPFLSTSVGERVVDG